MEIKSLTRRKFLVNTFMGMFYTTACSSVFNVAYAVKPEHAQSGKKLPKNLLGQVLGFRVGGMEKSNKIAKRLADNINYLGNKSYGNLLQQATVATYELQRTPGVLKKGKQSVSSNLNLLLGQIYNLDSGRGESQPLARAILSTTIFATHGIHYEITHAAQKRARQATKLLKDKNSPVPRAERLAMKRALQDYYSSRVKSVATNSSWLPETVKIPRVWIMPRSLAW